MLTCGICGEELLFEEDMKTHLLLSHLERDVSCPLCSLSGVSYDDLAYHIAAAHPEDRVPAQEPDRGGDDDDDDDDDGGVHSPSRPRPPPGTRRALSDLRRSPVSSGGGGGGGGGGFPAGAEISPPAATITAAGPRRDPTSPTPSFGGGGRRRSSGGCAGVTPDPRPRECGGDGDDEKQGGRYPCPLCALVCSDSRLLQEHVEVHLQAEDSAQGEEKRSMCPVCSAVCDDELALHQHVEEHFSGTAKDSAAFAPVSPGSDFRLARQLQAEEDERRRKEEAKLEAEEFKKLKEQFGVGGGGGYRQQIERRMEKAVARGLMAPADFHNKRAKVMESLASGVDDGSTRTQGTLGALCEYYQKEPRGCVHVWLSAETDHYNSSEGDGGWGCGYRNLQMLLSALQRIQTFTDCLPEGEIPSVPRLQRMIEAAWKEGLDPQGASHFNHRLQGTRAWIGATEIYALLTSLGIRASITDFHKPTGPGDTHPRMFEWVKQYFAQSSRGGRLPPRVVQTSLPPLYLQHQGHSRSIIGVEERKNGSLCLLVLDPDCGLANARKLLCADGVAAAVRRIQRFPSNVKHKQYQVVAVDQVLSPEEKQVRVLASRALRVDRIP